MIKIFLIWKSILDCKLFEPIKYIMSIRNVARRVRSNFVSCGYSSSDNSSQTTEPQIVHPIFYCLATCKKADTHKIYRYLLIFLNIGFFIMMGICRAILVDIH